MIRIGVANIDVSHPKAFAEYLKKDGRARYVAVYNDGFRGDDEVEAFMRGYGLEKRCDSVEELADCVDIGFVQDATGISTLITRCRSSSGASPYSSTSPSWARRPTAGGWRSWRQAAR